MSPSGTAAPPRRLYYVDHGVPRETTEQVRAACDERGIAFERVLVQEFDFGAPSPLVPGDLLFRPAVSLDAIRAEQHLYRPGVGTLYAADDDVFFDTGASRALFERAGLPIPRCVYLHTRDRDLLEAHVDRLGGFPVLAKIDGGSGGEGIVFLESRAALYSFADLALAQGLRPWLTAFVPDAEHWRVVVVGGRAVAGYRNIPEEDDFRTYDGELREDYRLPDDPGLLRIAEEAVATLRVEFGGVDLLVAPTGDTFLLEVNFPCYFASIKEVSGYDVAGVVLDHLVSKVQTGSS